MRDEYDNRVRALLTALAGRHSLSRSEKLHTCIIGGLLFCVILPVFLGVLITGKDGLAPAFQNPVSMVVMLATATAAAMWIYNHVASTWIFSDTLVTCESPFRWTSWSLHAEEISEISLDHINGTLVLVIQRHQGRERRVALIASMQVAYDAWVA